ncbi:hypothetical protein ValSw33_24 [Vibrio phage ValSw3-3]|nr:hypothetical protein ValSw33_24 [Vibrio phage ValSw3-3]
MTNKVKPFFIRITDDMTPQMVQDAFDKCVDAGAIAANGCKGVMSKFHYQGNFDVSLYSVFGVNAGFGTYIEENSDYFDDNAQEITLDQLDEWLGLEVEQEWKNGDECMIRGKKLIYIGESIEADIHCVQELGSCLYRNAHISVIEKPETPEQKAERERLENGRELWLKHQQALADVKILPSGKNKAWDSNMLSKDEMESWCILAENVTWMK